MIIGDRLREMREAKKLSQGDIEKRTGLFRCYISRVENGQRRGAYKLSERGIAECSHMTSRPFLLSVALLPKFCEKAQCFAVGQYCSRQFVKGWGVLSDFASLCLGLR